jgi:lysophospholipase L1-like esterase
MTRIKFLIFLIACCSTAYSQGLLNPGTVKVPIVERPLLWNKFQPFDGNIALQGISGAAVWEPSVFETPAGVEMWYTTRDPVTPTNYVIARAVAPDINSAFVFDDYYLGIGHNSFTLVQNGGCAWYDAGTYYVVTSSGYGVSGTSDGQSRLWSSSNLASGFTNLGVIFTQAMFPVSSSALGNVAIVLGTDKKPALINGEYYALVESLHTSNYWRMYAAKSSSLTSGWTIVKDLTSAQVVPGAMYGGAWAMYINGVIHFVYHYGSQTGDLPTLVSYATSTDFLSTAIIREAPFSFYNPYPFGADTDQIADPWIVEIDGSTHLFHELAENSGTFGAEIRTKSFPGTIPQLFQGVFRNVANPPLDSRKIIFEGNSLSDLSATGFVYNENYVPGTVFNNVKALTDPDLVYYCFSKSGRTQTEINASISSLITPNVKANDIIFLWEGTNDMFVNGLSGAAAYANLITYRNTVVAMGAKLVVGTVAARDWATDDADLMDRIDDYNDLIRANSGLFHGVADIAASTLFDTKADASNTTYYLSDKLHLTQAGYDAVIAIITPVVTSIL